MKINHKLPEEYKNKIVLRVLTDEITMEKAAQLLNIRQSYAYTVVYRTLYKWIKSGNLTPKAEFINQIMK